MTSVRAIILMVAGLPALPSARAQGQAPANTLVDLQRQFAGCMAGKTIGPAGSRLTIKLMMKRDGSILGKPRITFSILRATPTPGSASSTTQSARSKPVCPSKSRRRSAARSPGPFVITLGQPKPEQRI